jgi:hypothetical protein
MKSFRYQYGEDSRLLGLPVTIEYVDSEGKIKRREVKALIDTGATQCCIDKKLAKECNFISIGKTKAGTSEKGGIWEMKFIHKDQLPVMDVTSYCCASQPYGVPEVFKGLS